MKLSFNKSMFVYFCVTTTITVLISGAATFYFWKNGLNSIENVSSFSRAAGKLNSLQEKNVLDKIDNYLKQDQINEAIAMMDLFNKTVKEVHDNFGVENTEQLNQEMGQLKTDLNKILSTTSISSLLHVFRTKVDNFNDFVIQNKWRTLTRISNSMKIRLNSLKSNNAVVLGKLRNSYVKFSKDINFMESVTKGSVLSNADKNLIVLKLNALRTELNLMKEYLNYYRAYRTSFQKVKETYKSWHASALPLMAQAQFSAEDSTKNVLYIQLGSVVFVILSLFAAIGLYSVFEKRVKRKVEKEVIDLVKDGVIPLEGKMTGEWSQLFKDDIQVYREYIHKRMSFGSIFQDAMPFSSILLDSNLNLVWANSLFFEHWSLDSTEQKKSEYTWDTLQRFTNLGENDPVVTAVKENIAGIYQIQVKTEGAESAAPFEMYVSPVEYAGQTRIMVIFYPLRSIEETMRNQMKSVVGPVSRSLDAISKEMFEGEAKDKVLEDFKAAGLDHIFKSFENVSENFLQRKLSFLDEIERLNNKIYELSTRVNQYEVCIGNQEDLQVQTVGDFKNVKSKIIESISLRGDLEAGYENLTSNTKNILDKETNLLSKSGEIIESLNDNRQAITTITKVRDEFKELKSKTDMMRSKISNSIDSISRGNVSPEVMNRLASEMKSFEEVLQMFSKVSTSLDVGLSKAQIIMDGHEIPTIENEKLEFKTLEESFNSIQSEHLVNMKSLTEKDEELVKSLKGLYTSFQQMRVNLDLAIDDKTDYHEHTQQAQASDDDASDSSTDERVYRPQQQQTI